MRSTDLPPTDRFEWWCEQAARDTAPSEFSSPRTDDFQAVVTLADLGPAQLSIHTLPEVRAVRTPALIRHSDPERYGLSMIAANALWLAQHDHDSTIDSGDLVLHDTSQPYDSRALPGTIPMKMLILHFPKAALPLRPDRLNRLLAHRMSAGAGMNAIFARYLTSLASALELGEVGEPEMQRLGEVALDLAAATLAAQLDAEDRLTPETRQQALLSRIEAFIDHNLGDPDLTPAAIADHHHISLGYLHRLFQSRELTVAAWIRRQRLQRCSADLIDPRLQSRPVHAIGARWGFRNPTDFSRAFRAAYGMPPGDYRRHAPAAGITTDAPGVDPASRNW